MSTATDDVNSAIVPLLCERSPAYWATQFLWNYEDDISFQIGKHHVIWSEMTQNHNRICNLTHRDGGKSFFFSFAYILHWLYYGKGDVYLFSNTENQAKKLLGKIQDQIEKNDKLAHLRPPPKKRGKAIKWSSTEMQTPGGHVYALGYGTSVRGAHPKLIICDDILTDECMYSEQTRKRSIEYFKSAVTNMIVPSGQIIVVGTPFHLSDLYGYLKKNTEYIYKVFPAISKDEHGNEFSLWPSRYPLATLKAREREIGKLSFSREFLCLPMDDGASLFPYKVISKAFDPIATLPKTYEGGNIFIGFDPAISAEIGADGTAAITILKDDLENMWILDVFYEVGIDMKTQQDKLKELNARYKPTRIFIESNAYQKVLFQELKRTTAMPVMPHRTGKQKNDFNKGVPRIRTMFDNGKIKIPRGDDDSIDRTQPLIDQLMAFGYANGKVMGVGDHDDLVMALWMALECALHKAWNFEFI